MVAVVAVAAVAVEVVAASDARLSFGVGDDVDDDVDDDDDGDDDDGDDVADDVDGDDDNGDLQDTCAGHERNTGKSLILTYSRNFGLVCRIHNT